MVKHIRCAQCRFTRQDMHSSEYSQKHCRQCEVREDCEICQGCKLYEKCKARASVNKSQGCDRRLENVCSRQELKWAAIQCVNRDSDCYRALLNITIDGDMQDEITWCGCAWGEEV